MGFSRQPTAPRSSTTTSERKVFTLYCRPLRKYLSFLFALAALLSSCRRTAPAPPLFVSVAPEASGITFANTLLEERRHDGRCQRRRAARYLRFGRELPGHEGPQRPVHQQR